MDGLLTSELHSNLHQLSTENFKALVKYYETGILPLQARRSILNELMQDTDTTKDVKAFG